MTSTPKRNNAKSPSMRGASTVYILDDPGAWQWAMNLLTQHMINSDGNRTSRRIKGSLARLLQSPKAMRLFPIRDLPTDWQGVEPKATLILKAHGDAVIFFNREECRVTRLLPSRWQYMRAHWIHSQEAVKNITPNVGGWNDEKLTFQEDFVVGQTVPLHDLNQGFDTIRRLWPKLADVYRSRTVHRRLRGENSLRYEGARTLFQSAGLEHIWKSAHDQKVRHGLVHGDLKPQNVLIDGSRIIVIDWYESFALAPPLFDLFYYLFWFARFYSPQRVARLALADPTWLHIALPGCLDATSPHASLVAFARESVFRLQSEQNSRRIIARLKVFINEIAQVLNL